MRPFKRKELDDYLAAYFLNKLSLIRLNNGGDMVGKGCDDGFICFPFFLCEGELWKYKLDENLWENLTSKENHIKSAHQINKEYLERISGKYLDKNKDDINKKEVL